ncbi:MAG: hypothetical protein JSW35_03020 [Deltaproteobacteria bacterium]|nr:MAG: hypothetical protein JSW35_03020 [Deltaproteobacteria bacterium]
MVNGLLGQWEIHIGGTLSLPELEQPDAMAKNGDYCYGNEVLKHPQPDSVKTAGSSALEHLPTC